MLFRRNSALGEQKLGQIDVITAVGNGYTQTKNSQNGEASLKIRVCGATLLGPHLWNLFAPSHDANSHQMFSLGCFTHVKHPDFSHWQLFIFQFYHTFCVNISLWFRLRLFLTLSQLVCLPLFITLLPPSLKVATQLNLWYVEPLFTLHLCRKGKKTSQLHLLSSIPHEGCHSAGLSWSQIHFTENFWQISFQYMRKRCIQKFRLKHFR